MATPFGGFSKAPRPAPIKPLQLEPVPDYPELQGDTAINRPSFNRSATGWVSVGGPVPLHTVSLEPVLIPESEDLWTHEVTQRCCLLRCCTMVSRARESVLLGFDGSTYAACTVFLVLSWFSMNSSPCTVGWDITGINGIYCILMCIRVFYLADTSFCSIKWWKKSKLFFLFFIFHCISFSSTEIVDKMNTPFQDASVFGHGCKSVTYSPTWPQVILSQWVGLSCTEGSLEWMMPRPCVIVVCKPITYRIVWDSKDTCEPL